MRKMLLVLCLAMLATLLGACGSNEKTSSKPKENQTKGKLSEDDYDKMYTDPKKYKGYEVELTGKVFTEPEKDDKKIVIQMWGDPEKSEKNTIVGIEDPSFKVKQNDYVRVKGIVKDVFEGENAFGAKVTAPAILAKKVEVIGYIAATAPTVKELKVEKEINQNGIIVNIQKVELAKNQTRVYIKIKNTTKDKASFYSHSAKLIDGSKQLENEYYSSETTGLPELQSDLLPGVETEGVIFYPAIDPKSTKFQIHAEASSDNYEMDFQPYVFEVAVNQ